MNRCRRFAVFALCATLLLALPLPIGRARAAGTADLGPVAPKPLFRDPVFDGAADPSLCYNRADKKWYLFYTNRRANVPNTPGVSWVHGTPIGIASSADCGATWRYIGTAKIHYGASDTTFWAPDVIYRDGLYHMFLAVVPGIFNDWKHPRDIIHLTSADMRDWKYVSTLKLASDRVIDPYVFLMPDGSWKMWYNNERAGKSEWVATSPDLTTWTDGPQVTHDKGGEGPVVFRWRGAYWLIVDIWQGLAVYRSPDTVTWTRQEGSLLADPGAGPDDAAKADHADVVVSGDRAFLFYFTQFGRRSSIQVVELNENNGLLTCDRTQPTHIKHLPPTNPSRRKRGEM